MDLVEYIRPWKLATLAIGIALLIIGSIHIEASDWDIPISLIMAILAYLTAPLCARAVFEWRWKEFPAVILLTWFSIDGCYFVYWSAVNPIALDGMRLANFYASLPLYWICGFIWLHQGNLSVLIKKYES